jgi:hypothetical protein
LDGGAPDVLSFDVLNAAGCKNLQRSLRRGNGRRVWMDLVTRQGNGAGEYKSCETDKLLYAVAEAIKVCTEYAFHSRH